MSILISNIFPGGLIVPSQNISEILKNFTKKHNLPLYTFAECMTLSGGYFVASVGNLKAFLGVITNF